MGKDIKKGIDVIDGEAGGSEVAGEAGIETPKAADETVKKVADATKEKVGEVAKTPYGLIVEAVKARCAKSSNVGVQNVGTGAGGRSLEEAYPGLLDSIRYTIASNKELPQVAIDKIADVVLKYLEAENGLKKQATRGVLDVMFYNT